MHFGENQLSRSLIGLSPLTTGHPPGFQPWWVRSSTRSYPRFNLPMARSLRFGSWACNSNALFGLAFATATPHGLTSLHTANSQAHSSKGTQSRPTSKLANDAPTACRHTVSGTISLRSRGTFHHSLTVLSAIGHQGIFRLSGWSRQIHTGFLGPRATWEFGLASSSFARHYSRNHGCFLFLRVLRCFTSPRSLHTAYVFSSG